jgi:hypothetical protein
MNEFVLPREHALRMHLSRVGKCARCELSM